MCDIVVLWWECGHMQFPSTTCELISRLRSWRDMLLGQVQQVSSMLKLERHSLQLRDFSLFGASVEVPGQYVADANAQGPLGHVRIASFAPGIGRFNDLSSLCCTTDNNRVKRCFVR